MRRYFVTYIKNTTLLHMGAIILLESHIRNFNNTSGLFVKDSKGVRFGDIANKGTLKSFRIKFGQMNTFLKIVALTTEHPEVLDIGLVAGKYFIRCLVQSLAEIKPIGRVKHGIDGFGPKVIRRFEFR
jgi:hypothetical protein